MAFVWNTYAVERKRGRVCKAFEMVFEKIPSEESAEASTKQREDKILI